MFRTLGIAASGLSAQRVRMETIATNIANAETTRTEGGGPYRRRVVEMQAADPSQFSEAYASASGVAGVTSVTPDSVVGNAPADRAAGVQVTAITEDAREGPLVYDPSHPDANKDGYVRYPNVRVTDEIVDLMDARRMYEANATVFQATKSMLRRSIDI
ncbi:MAG: flagellar basal body rod protein FlgC [Gemmatimonadetes bacterium]|nr:flagellar basal body rod protein FlgC [Gemmatimonadota bacterium]